MSNLACHATPKLSYGGLKLLANGDHSSFALEFPLLPIPLMKNMKKFQPPKKRKFDERQVSNKMLYRPLREGSL